MVNLRAASRWIFWGSFLEKRPLNILSVSLHLKAFIIVGIISHWDIIVKVYYVYRRRLVVFVRITAPVFCERQCALIHVECDPHVLYAIRSLFMRLNNLFAIFFM
jgi:hypothetical protein